MYSETPPEKLTSDSLPRQLSGSSRNRSAPPARGEPPSIASNSLSAMRAASALRLLVGELKTEIELEAKIGAEAAAGFLQPHDLVLLIEHDEPRADIDRGDVEHLAVRAHGDLRGAAADIDVHHRRVVA